MSKSRVRIILFLAAGLIASTAFAETVELVTYYPSSATTGDLHTTSLTVGSGYTNVTPNDGEAFIENLLSVGSTDPVDIGGGWGAPQRTKLWLQDDTPGVFPALVIAGTPGGGGAGGGAVQFVDATTNRPVGDFGVSGVGAGSAASEVGIVGRQNSTAISFYTTPALLPVLRMVIQSNGRVGIPTPNPEAPLHISSSSVGGNPWIGQLLIAPTADNQDASISLRTTYGTDRVWTLLAGAGGGSTNFRIFDSTAGLDRLNINAAGNAGIGTTDPQVKLDVAQGGAIRVGNAYLSSGLPQYAIVSSNSWYNGTAWTIPDATQRSAAIVLDGATITLYQTQTPGGTDWAPRLSIAANGVTLVSPMPFVQSMQGNGAIQTAIGNDTSKQIVNRDPFDGNVYLYYWNGSRHRRVLLGGPANDLPY